MQIQGTIMRRICFQIYLGVLIYPSLSLAFPIPQIPFAPRQYICRETTLPINIDGILDDTPWLSTPWTEPFLDIEGPDHTPPTYLTRTRMTWDQEYFYVSAILLEPNLWGTMKKRDSVIYYDNDFEIFIDPDGDNHQYYELEINALGTEWDLRLEKPYRDGGPAIDSWDIAGLKTAIHHQGTINDHSDTDVMWTVEMAIPWNALGEFTDRPSPPLPGDIWRINFSRVQWKMKISNGGYVKQTDPVTGKHLPECNWVWSPQGLIAMHYPEMWGEVMFTDQDGIGNFATNEQHIQLAAAHELMPIYYAQKQYIEDNGRFASSLTDLGITPPESAIDIKMTGTDATFTVEMITASGTFSVDENGLLLKSAL
jgi:hypothetical protein